MSFSAALQSKPATALLRTASLGCLLLPAACSSKHTGAGTVTRSGRLVDPSWVTATQACWPDLTKNGYTADDLKRNLADSGSFHNAFPVYTAQSRADIDALLAKPLGIAPGPDISKLTHAQTPVLTRGQAALGTGPQAAVVQSTNGIAPPDALCSIQPGVPQGFRK